MSQEIAPQEICPVCKSNPAEITHHTSYSPEVFQRICQPCHAKIHLHNEHEQHQVTDEWNKICPVCFCPANSRSLVRRNYKEKTYRYWNFVHRLPNGKKKLCYLDAAKDPFVETDEVGNLIIKDDLGYAIAYLDNIDDLDSIRSNRHLTEIKMQICKVAGIHHLTFRRRLGELLDSLASAKE